MQSIPKTTQVQQATLPAQTNSSPITLQQINSAATENFIGGNGGGNGVTYMQVRRSREAQAVMRRDRHIFKLVTIYVVDKLNFNLQKKDRAKLNQGASETEQQTQHVRGSSAPTKGMHPCHFKHGLRTSKHCLVCEGILKPNSIAQEKKDSKLPFNVPDEIISSEKKFPIQPISNMNQNTFSVDGGNYSERGFNLTNQAANQETAPKSIKLQHEDSTSTQAKKDAPNQTNQEAKPSNQEQILNIKQTSVAAPTKRDGDIEEYQRRRITLNDFMHGQPSMKLMFTKHVRKFNRELLKATCLVIGCKRMYAHKIAEKVFDEFNQILNNLSDHLGFENHFNVSDLISGEIPDETSNIEEKLSIPQRRNTRGMAEPDARKHITTITVPAPLFKYILKRYLVEKYRYSRPEYLKDFYVASDLVQSKRNILVLLAGTSGTGKSTLSSLLGSRLGISTVLSTDTIRHVMRNFVAKEDDPIIFASTYETAAFVSEDIQSKKKRTLMGYKDQCNKVQAELEKVIDDYQRRNESLVVEGVHLTVRFMLQMMKKYPSCIPFVICITNEDKHKERFAVRTKHMTIDPKFNKYIKNVQSIRTIQKYLIKKAEAALIPRIDNSNIDKSIGLIHATIVRCLRQIAEGTPIFDVQRKQAIIMHQEFANISKNKLSSKDAQKFFIHQKVNKSEILAEYMKQQTNPELEEKLKRYKKSTSMGELSLAKSKQQPKKLQDEEETKQLTSQIYPIFHLPSQPEKSAASFYSDGGEDSPPRPKSIHVILRPEAEPVKLSEVEKKAIKRQMLNVFEDFPEDEQTDTKASLIASKNADQGGMGGGNTKYKDKKGAKGAVIGEEEQRLRDEKKRMSDQQKQIEEEKIQIAILEAQKKELIAAAIEEQQRIINEKEQQQQRIQQALLIAPKSHSLVIPGDVQQDHKNNAQDDDEDQDSCRAANKSFEYLGEEEDTNHDVAPQTSINIKQIQLKREPSTISNTKQVITVSEEISAINKENPIEEPTIKDPTPKPMHSGIKRVESFEAQIGEIQSLSSLEHLKQLDSFGKEGRNIYEVNSDMAEPGDLNDINMEEEVKSSQGEENKSAKENANFRSQVFMSSGNAVNSSSFIETNMNKDMTVNSDGEGEAASKGGSVNINGNEDSNEENSNFMPLKKQNTKKLRDKEDTKSVEPPINHQANKDSLSGSGHNGNKGDEVGSNDGYQSTKESTFFNQLASQLGAGEKKLGERGQLLFGSARAQRDKSGAAAQSKTSKNFGRLASFAHPKKKKKKGIRPLGALLGANLNSNAPAQKLEVSPRKSITKNDTQEHNHIHKIQPHQVPHAQDDNQSNYSGSGMAPSLVSQSINFFPQGGAHTDNHSVAHGLEKLNESGESSDETNSQDAEASDHEAISEEVSYSHSSESDNEEEQEDAIAKKQTSFNNNSTSLNNIPLQLQQQMTNQKNLMGVASLNKAKSNECVEETHSGSGSPPKHQKEGEIKIGSVGSANENVQTVSKSKSQPSENQIMIQGVNAFNASTGEEESLASGGDAYDKIKPLSKKSFDEDKTTSNQVGGNEGNLHLKSGN